jgi:hypothetical protein
MGAGCRPDPSREASAQRVAPKSWRKPRPCDDGRARRGSGRVTRERAQPIGPRSRLSGPRSGWPDRESESRAPRAPSRGAAPLNPGAVHWQRPAAGPGSDMRDSDVRAPPPGIRVEGSARARPPDSDRGGGARQKAALNSDRTAVAGSCRPAPWTRARRGEPDSEWPSQGPGARRRAKSESMLPRVIPRAERRRRDSDARGQKALGRPAGPRFGPARGSLRHRSRSPAQPVPRGPRAWAERG